MDWETFNSFMTEVSIIEKTVHRFREQISGFYMIGISVMKELTNCMR